MCKIIKLKQEIIEGKTVCIKVLEPFKWEEKQYMYVSSLDEYIVIGKNIWEV